MATPILKTVESRIFGVCLLFRLCNALLVRTYFDPDEFWQGPEIAHYMAFGYALVSLPFFFRAYASLSSYSRRHVLICCSVHAYPVFVSVLLVQFLLLPCSV